MNLESLLRWHKNEVAHCALGYSNAKSNRESRRWLMRLKGHSRTVTILEEIVLSQKCKVLGT